MSDVVIKAEGLGKKYLIGHQRERERYTALRDVMARNVKSVLHKTRQVLSGQQLLAGDEIEAFWALRDINFEIKRGDRVGIIGRNGAGKSTLLKVLSRITEPSAGRVEIRGRVASLLEVGTGFHPELTGRENIYLNGAILGMTRSEIKKKFDEIVDFAGVEKFLDTPVKRYSSGMYVRLAFAVAAHLEPEILVVDEVLAVGDAEFQKKCLGKMEEVSKNEGRTVLFVSHNTGLISQLCENCILLTNGKILTFEQTRNVLKTYSLVNLKSQEAIYSNDSRIVNKFNKIELHGESGISNSFLFESHIKIYLKMYRDYEFKDIEVGISILNSMQQKIFTSHYALPIEENVNKTTLSVIECTIPGKILVPGIYYIDSAIFSGNTVVYDYQKEIIRFEIIDSGFELSGFSNYGFVNIDCRWETIK